MPSAHCHSSPSRRRNWQKSKRTSKACDVRQVVPSVVGPVLVVPALLVLAAQLAAVVGVGQVVRRRLQAGALAKRVALLLRLLQIGLGIEILACALRVLAAFDDTDLL